MNLKSPLHIKPAGINLEQFSKDILLNKFITTASPSNSYEILYDCNSFKQTIDLILDELIKNTNETFHSYVKSVYGYVVDDTIKHKLIFNKNQLKESLKIIPKYSFIFVIESNMNILLKIKSNQKNFIIEKGELLIFNTYEFVEDISLDMFRLALVGSISNDTEIIETKKHNTII